MILMYSYIDANGATHEGVTIFEIEKQLRSGNVKDFWPDNQEYKASSKYVELSDGTVVNTYDIILLNVEDSAKVKGGKEYRLYLRGKKMTLKLTEEDYKIVKHKLLAEL